MARSYVVTGGGRGIGRAIAERLSADGQVVVVERDREALGWAQSHPGITAVAGDAGDEAVAEQAAATAEATGPLAGWVNNAAIFRDAALHDTPATEVVDLIAANIRLTVTGCAAAIRCYLHGRRPGAIVNVSSHQAQRPVPGAMPYATAKAAIEGLTRTLAVDYGSHGIRTNVVALGTISTERYKAMVTERPDVDAQLRGLHPLGRVGLPADVATVVADLLSDRWTFVNGVTLPVDGGRSVLGQDPEARAVVP